LAAKSKYYLHTQQKASTRLGHSEPACGGGENHDRNFAELEYIRTCSHSLKRAQIFLGMLPESTDRATGARISAIIAGPVPAPLVDWQHDGLYQPARTKLPLPTFL